MVDVDVALSAGALLGECPLWSPEEEVLYWVDIDGRQVHRYDPASGVDESRETPGRPGSLARTTRPGLLLVAAEHEAVWFDWHTGEAHPWMDLEPLGTGNRMNDGRTDPAGRFWVGSMYEYADEGRYTGMLHRIEADGSSSVVRRGIGVSNALAFDPERRRMYFADSLRGVVWRYDYDLETGAARNETPFVDWADFPELAGRPDGACVDSEGCYWVAAVRGWAVVRFTPDGRLDRKIDVPVMKPSMTAFGGTGLDTLYVTSIGGGGSHPSAEDQPHAGHLFAIDPGTTGLPDAPFAGIPVFPVAADARPFTSEDVHAALSEWP